MPDQSQAGRRRPRVRPSLEQPRLRPPLPKGQPRTHLSGLQTGPAAVALPVGQDGAGSGAAVPNIGKIGVWGMARRLPRMLTFILSAASETCRMDNEARARQYGAAFYAELSDE